MAPDGPVKSSPSLFWTSFGLIFVCFMAFFDCFMAFLIVFKVFGGIPYFACIWAVLLYFCSPALSEAGTPWLWV